MKWETKYLPFLFGIFRKNYYFCSIEFIIKIMTSRNRIPSNYCDVKSFLESRNIKISDIIKEMMANGKDYDRWLKNLLHEDMTEFWFIKYFPDVITKTQNRFDYQRQSDKETSNYGICRSAFEFKQDVEISTLFEDWIRLKLEKSGIDNLKANTKASKSNLTDYAVTDEDYEYTSDSGETVLIELKTRYLKNEWSVQFRDGADKVKENKSLVLVYYPFKSKAAVVDFGNEDVVKRIQRFDSWGKSGEKLILNQNDFFDFDVCSNDLSILKTKIEEVLEKRNRK